MALPLLERLLGRGEKPTAQRKAFRLPGALHDEVRLLLLDSGDLTDLLFAMPLVEATRDRYGGCRLGLVCEERVSGLAAVSGAFDQLEVYKPEQLRPRSPALRQLAAALASDEWEVALLLGRQHDPARAELALASGATIRLGPLHRDAWPQVNCQVRNPRTERYRYRRSLTWGRLLGVPLDGVPPHWPLPEERRRQAAQLVHFNKPRKDQLLIGVDPGMGKEGTLLAPQNLAFLANHLGSHVRSKLIALSADENVARREAFEALVRAERLDLPRNTLEQTVPLLTQCDLFLSANTDLFHFAVALGVPTLGLFTARDGSQWVPEGVSNLEILSCEEGQRVSLADFMERVEVLLRRR